jgi:quercetin dioxygenase-like cupin family protein
MEPDNPGMHFTDTVDYVIVLDGEVWLEVDGGKDVLLKKHDVVIQNGTRHAWRNKSDRNVTIAAVLVGARWR